MVLKSQALSPSLRLQHEIHIYALGQAAFFNTVKEKISEIISLLLKREGRHEKAYLNTPPADIVESISFLKSS